MRRIIFEKAILEDAYSRHGKLKLVAKELGVTQGVICKNFKAHGIPYLLHPKSLTSSISSKAITKLYVEGGKTLEDTSKILGISTTGLKSLMTEYDIPINRLNQFTLFSKEKDIVIGSILGDGYINKHSSLEIGHSSKQLKYLLYKQLCLARLLPKSTGIEHLTRRIFPDGSISYRLRTLGHAYMQHLREIFYEGKTKRVPYNIEEFLTPRVLAVWYMDDGGLRGKACGRIATCCFSEREVTLLSDALNNKFALSSRVMKEGKYFNIYLPARNNTFKDFASIIKLHVPPSMMYKLNP